MTSHKKATEKLSKILVSSPIANVGQPRLPERYQLQTVARNYETREHFFFFYVSMKYRVHVRSRLFDNESYLQWMHLVGRFFFRNDL